MPWDYFPSLHTSYQISSLQQVMASYSRRIQRPRSFYLEPFETWMDAYNVRKGNPGLKPEYIDSYELGVQTSLGTGTASAEAYYRVSHNKIEHIRSVYDDNVRLHSVKNIGTDYALGSEFMLRFGPRDFWNVNLMGNVFNCRITGTPDNDPFSRESFSWGLRMNHVFLPWKNGQVQVSAFYAGPSVSAQGTQEGFFMTDLAVRQDLFGRKISVILQIRDLLGTANREFSAAGPDFYRYEYMDRTSPTVMLTLRFNINNYRNGERQNQQNGASDYLDTGNDWVT